MRKNCKHRSTTVKTNLNNYKETHRRIKMNVKMKTTDIDKLEETIAKENGRRERGNGRGGMGW